MRILVVALALSLLAFAVPADAVPDLKPHGACVGYDMCGPIDGDAVFCLKIKTTWRCGQCEACGNLDRVLP